MGCFFPNKNVLFKQKRIKSGGSRKGAMLYALCVRTTQVRRAII
jgi:hypothetical protein